MLKCHVFFSDRDTDRKTYGQTNRLTRNGQPDMHADSVQKQNGTQKHRKQKWNSIQIDVLEHQNHKHNKTRVSKRGKEENTGQVKSKKALQDNKKQKKTRKTKTTWDKTTWGKTRQDKIRQDKTRQDMTRQDRQEKCSEEKRREV